MVVDRRWPIVNLREQGTSLTGREERVGVKYGQHLTLVRMCDHLKLILKEGLKSDPTTLESRTPSGHRSLRRVHRSRHTEQVDDHMHQGTNGNFQRSLMRRSELNVSEHVDGDSADLAQVYPDMEDAVGGADYLLLTCLRT